MKILSIALLGAGLLMSGAVAAKDYRHAKQPANANQYYGLYRNPSDSLAPSRMDRANFDHSGTRGREGLGASPFHPEGPGNVVAD
jgi:hypothetical protein